MLQGDLATTFRHAMEAYSRRDYDAAVVDFDPAIEWIVDVTVAPDATTYHGHEGVKRFWEAWEEAISGLELEIEECHGVGPGSGARHHPCIRHGSGQWRARGSPRVSRRSPTSVRAVL